MAYPTKDSFTFSHITQTDYPGWTPEQAKQNLNARSEEMRLALNAVVNLMNAITDSASGADNMGATPIATSPSTVQGILEWLKEQIDLIVAGGVADDSLYDVKLANAAGQIKDRFSTHESLMALTTAIGHVFLATPTETTTGTDGTRAVTPLGLKSATDLLIPLSQKGVANGVGTLDSGGNPVQKPYAKGTYTGDNAYSRTINIGFTPSAVLVLSGGVGLVGGTSVYGGLAITNVPANSSNPSVEIVSNGFNVKHDTNTPIVDTNQFGNVYTYMAFR